MFEGRDTMKYLIDLIALTLLYAFYFSKKWKRRGRDVLFFNTLMYVYLSSVLFFTLMPIIAKLPFILNHPYTPMNMVPFVDVLLGRGDFLRQVVLNVIMTIPFGFLYPLTRGRNPGLFKTVSRCFLLSLGIELLQPLIDGCRSADITDLITNAAGSVIGYGFYILFKPVTGWISEQLREND